MIISKWLVNNTIKLKAIFRNYENQNINPQQVFFKLYDSNNVLILSQQLSELNRTSTGVYEYNYVFNEIGKYTYEFLGANGDYQMSNKKDIEIVFKI